VVTLAGTGLKKFLHSRAGRVLERNLGKKKKMGENLWGSKGNGFFIFHIRGIGAELFRPQEKGGYSFL